MSYRLIAPVLLLFAHAARAQPSAPADSLRGRVELIGSEPVVLLTRTASSVVLTGGLSPVVARVGRTEVTVWGAAAGDGLFRVDRFVVRAANGEAAEDGELARDGSGFLLLTADGRRLVVPYLPAELRDRVGWRIWLAGPLDRPPVAFGVIAQVRRPEE
jgi:hypothetical protein